MRHRVPASGGQLRRAAPIAPAAAPNTARIKIMNKRYDASKITQKDPSRFLKNVL
jgi:hypothetical protein